MKTENGVSTFFRLCRPFLWRQDCTSLMGGASTFSIWLVPSPDGDVRVLHISVVAFLFECSRQRISLPLSFPGEEFYLMLTSVGSFATSSFATSSTWKNCCRSSAMDATLPLFADPTVRASLESSPSLIYPRLLLNAPVFLHFESFGPGMLGPIVLRHYSS